MSPILKMQDICKDYQVGRTSLRVLKNINLEVEEGDYLAIMGPSGSGKTTLMNLIGCLDTPTSGEYYLDGRDITKCSDNQLAEVRNKKIGFVFQSFNLMPKLTAVDNVALPLLYAGVRKSERIRRAQEALRKVGLEERMNFRQDQLSGGQCQRVAIARAMVSNPGILLADEPTGALDSESGRQIMELFREIHEQGTTVIMITHDAGIAANADRTIFIRDGLLYTDASEPETEFSPETEEPAADQEPLWEEPAADQEPRWEEPVAEQEPRWEEPVAEQEPRWEEPVAEQEPRWEEPVAEQEPLWEEPAADQGSRWDVPAEDAEDAASSNQYGYYTASDEEPEDEGGEADV